MEYDIISGSVNCGQLYPYAYDIRECRHKHGTLNGRSLLVGTCGNVFCPRITLSNASAVSVGSLQRFTWNRKKIDEVLIDRG